MSETLYLEYKDCIKKANSINSLLLFRGRADIREKVNYTISIPTFRRPYLLKEAIESALNQNYSGIFNIVVVDNNPERNDETEQLMNQYRNHPQIWYYKNENNVGMAGNWNKCLILSDSDNVIMLHDDDVLSPYSLFVFSSIIPHLRRDWSMIKPNLTKFHEISNLSFKKPHKAVLNRLIPEDFYHGCAIGAPTAILLNRKELIKAGGYDEDVYPCIDYEMCVKQILTNSLYTLNLDSPVGGYRVSCNESISERTMDAFYEMSYKIGDALMSKRGVPCLVQKMIHSIRNDVTVQVLNDYYEMPDYRFKESSYPIIKISKKLNKILLFIDSQVTKAKHRHCSSDIVL